MATEQKRMRQLVGTRADWSMNNLVIGDGEIALERLADHSHRIKVGDGSKQYSDLVYFSDTVSPESFGCVGDGVTPDAVNFQKAVNAAAGKMLRLTPGATYYLQSTITIATPLVMFGDGAYVHTGALHITAFLITSSSVSIIGGDITGAGNAAFNTAGKLIDIQGVDNGAGVAATLINNIRIRGLRLHFAGRSAIRAQYVDRLWILENEVKDLGYAGVEIQSCSRVFIQTNNIRDVTPGSAGNTYGIYLSQTNSADRIRHPLSQICNVSGNILENIAWEGIDCHGGNLLDFSRNTLINCGDLNAAIAVIHADDETTAPIGAATNVTINGNRITGAQQYGIATSSSIASVIHENIAIQGNTLLNCGDGNVSPNVGGIRIGGAKNVSVSGNTLTFCAPYGVIVNSEFATGVTIEGNTFSRIVSQVVTTPAAILIDRGASGLGAIMIGGNTLRRASLGDTFEAVAGVRVVSTDGGNLRIAENHFDAATTKYSLTAAQAGGASSPVQNFGNDTIAVTTAVSFASVVITLPKPHSANTVFTPWAVIFASTAGIERTLLHCARTSPSSITVTAYTASGANFTANGTISIFWRTSGY